MLSNEHFTEEKIYIQGKNKIGATLCKPSNPLGSKYPAVLLIAGSGKADRNVNMPQIKTNIFKYLSVFFAKAGIISLRYDKRGCGESGGDYNEAGISDYIDDAVDALKYLKNHELVNQDRILILGHSEGAFIAPAVYNKENATGLILLCGGIRPGNELIHTQPNQLAKEIQELRGGKGFLLRLFHIDKLILWQFNRVLKRSLSTTEPCIKIFGLIKFNAKWLREFYFFKVKDYLINIKCSILVIGGEKDIQSDPNDAIQIAQIISGKSEAHIINNMNHLLRNFSGVHNLLSCQSQYKESVKNPLCNNLLDTINNWLKKEGYDS
ncbi:MAG: alpha/beta hydrolase [Legionellales bacterium]|nr:alpha/beta hydrolase [Legionellales bacterium]